MTSATLTAPESEPDTLNLPRGVVYRHKADRPDLPHQFGVWDRDVKRYAWESFSDKAKGMAWAKDERRKMDRGEATALRPLVSEIGAAYIRRLEAKKASQSHINSIAPVIAELLAVGANDMAAPGFAEKVQRWLQDMTAHRPGQKSAPEAAPRTKRRKLTIARSIVHLAMNMEGRPLRYDPLRTIVIPTIQKHEKPVFTVAELRTLLADDSRWMMRRLLNETKQALAAAGGNKIAAAKALGVHRTTVFNRLAWTESEDPWWLFAASGVYTGLRPSEAQAIEWTWIRWDEDVLMLPAGAPGNKMKVERTVPLQPEYKAILLERLKPDMAGYIHAPEVTRCGESARCAMFQTYIKRCGLPIDGRGPHSLRHQHGALSTAMDMNPMQIMLNMGHDNVKVAHDYSRTATRFRRDVAGWPKGELRLMPATSADPAPVA